MREEAGDQDKRDAAKWPGVLRAYDYVLPSYQWMIARFEAADTRIQTLLAFVATVSAALPAVAKALTPTATTIHESRLLVGALVCGVLAMAVGVVARSIGGVTLVNPAALAKGHWAKKHEWDFKDEMLHHAARHFRQNASRIAWKGRVVTAMTALFLGELILFSLWTYLAI